MVLKWIFRIGVVIFVVGGAVSFIITAINHHVKSQSAGRIQRSITEFPADEEPRTALVLGAKVSEDGKLSNSLNDRVLTAVELYRAKRVNRLLMTGDRRDESYDEPAAMKRFAMELGVPESDIVIDNDGKRTRDSCERAKRIYGVERAIIVSQDYHLPRALFLCRTAGIDSIGMIANRRVYDSERYLNFREIFSTVSAWFESFG